MTKKKVRYLLSKRAVSDVDVYSVFKEFFKEYLKTDYEFTFDELEEEIKKIYLEKSVKDKLLSVMNRFETVEYKDEEIPKEHLREILIDFDSLLDDLIKKEQRKTLLGKIFGSKSIKKPNSTTNPNQYTQNKILHRQKNRLTKTELNKKEIDATNPNQNQMPEEKTFDTQATNLQKNNNINDKKTDETITNSQIIQKNGLLKSNNSKNNQNLSKLQKESAILQTKAEEKNDNKIVKKDQAKTNQNNNLWTESREKNNENIINNTNIGDERANSVYNDKSNNVKATNNWGGELESTLEKKDLFEVQNQKFNKENNDAGSRNIFLNQTTNVNNAHMRNTDSNSINSSNTSSISSSSNNNNNNNNNQVKVRKRDEDLINLTAELDKIITDEPSQELKEQTDNTQRDNLVINTNPNDSINSIENKNIEPGKTISQENNISKIINQIKESLSQNKTDKAKQDYKELLRNYELLAEEDKAKYYDQVNNFYESLH